MINIKNDSRDVKFESQQNKHYRKLRISLAVLTVVICSLNIRATTTQTLKHSRNMYRAMNKQLLLHDDLDIYWFGYRVGQYLINYPIHQYYFLGEFSQFLQRVENVMRNLQDLSFGMFNQQELNTIQQNIYVENNDGTFVKYQWNIQDGFTQPFVSNDTISIKEALINKKTVQIGIKGIKVKKGGDSLNKKSQQWQIILVVQPFSQTSIFVTLFLQQKVYLGFQHILHFILGLGTIYLFLSEVFTRIKMKKNINISKIEIFNCLKLTDIPDGLVIFFLLFSSFASFVNLYTVRYILLLDGVTCLISWLYILKLYAQRDDYHLSFLIKKSYLVVGRLFVSFGPVFIGFCLFALTAFCRYTNLFVSFHKTFISLFCVCYYNMSYQQYRTTERTNPISAIFFTTMLMLFTACIYSGMLVSVFCSYMWNKRQDKNKQQLLNSLKIQCLSCSSKYSFAQGYAQSLKKRLYKNQLQILQNQQQEYNQKVEVKYRNAIKSKLSYLQKRMFSVLIQNQGYIEDTKYESDSSTLQNQKRYCQKLALNLQKIKLLVKEIQKQDTQ